MKKIKTSLLVIGLVFAAIGMIWMGLGTGALRWPASSPMIGDHLWVTLGAGLAVMGLVLILLSRRLRCASRRSSLHHPHGEPTSQ